MLDPNQAELAGSGNPTGADVENPGGRVRRLSSQELFRRSREIEIEHAGKIYRLRLTQLNKLILTA